MVQLMGKRCFGGSVLVDIYISDTRGNFMGTKKKELGTEEGSTSGGYDFLNTTIREAIVDSGDSDIR